MTSLSLSTELLLVSGQSPASRLANLRSQSENELFWSSVPPPSNASQSSSQASVVIISPLTFLASSRSRDQGSQNIGATLAGWNQFSTAPAGIPPAAEAWGSAEFRSKARTTSSDTQQAITSTLDEQMEQTTRIATWSEALIQFLMRMELTYARSMAEQELRLEDVSEVAPHFAQAAEVPVSRSRDIHVPRITQAAEVAMAARA
ncbi:hypothetical protein HDU97_005861 [Phlyctochytrium planicorne]|nr:hypothetical protein HDU97_005861 [Phlyctochytrium planicorne]